jgi:hypothetical protein
MLGFRSFPFRLLAPVAVCAAGLSAASTATASCGDYLYSGHTRQRSVDFSPREVDESPAIPNTNRHRPPCHGPGCRNAPDQPPRSIPVTTPPRTDNVLSAVVAAAEEVPPTSCRFSASEAPHAPTGYLRRIDRPPRPSV